MLRDLRYAVHTLSRSPGYALMCIGVLALGIGANASIFSLIDSVILEALPYPNLDRLVFVWERFPNLPPPVGDRMEVAHANYVEWQRQNTVFDAMAAFHGESVDEKAAEQPRRVAAGFASASLFSLLGARARGRLFTAADERPGAAPVAVLTDGYYEARFQRDPHILGKTLTLGSTVYTVIGVLPRRFHLPSTYEGSDQLKADVFLPLSGRWKNAEDERRRELRVMARLRPGVSIERARTEMSALADRLAAADPKLNEGFHTAVFPFTVEDSGPQVHRALYILMGAVGFLLLIACANLANLTLARATLRAREVAVRLALGATRGRIVAQLVTESLVVSLAGAAIGLLLAHWSIRFVVSFRPDGIERPELIAINLPVFAFAAAVSLLTTMLFGLFPSISVARADLTTALKTGGAWGASGARVRSRQFLIAAEVTLALILVTGAGLMARSFRGLVHTGVGFDTGHLAAADLDLPGRRYPDDASQIRFYRALLERVRVLPGVRSAAVTDALPLHSVSFANFYIGGHPDPPIDRLPISDMSRVSGGYFETLGLRLAAGRLFRGEEPRDVAIVNQAFVAKFLPGENPLAQTVGRDRKQMFEIVGVVADYRAMGAENGARPTIFWPSLKMPAATLVVRTYSPPETLAAALRQALRSVDPTFPPPAVLPMSHYVDGWLSQHKLITLLLAVFAGLALLLGMIGIYGIISNLVTSRVREIGIRMAIGASPGNIGGMVLRQSMAPVLIGVLAGLAGSLVLSRFLESLLFQVRARDPITMALAPCIVLLISPAALWVPLRRATRIDCTVALRQE